MDKGKQNFCEQCLHYRACIINSEYVPSPCSCYEDKAGYRKSEEVAREVLEEVRELYITDDRYAALERRIKKKYGE